MHLSTGILRGTNQLGFIFAFFSASLKDVMIDWEIHSSVCLFPRVPGTWQSLWLVAGGAEGEAAAQGHWKLSGGPMGR